ncbi:polysaccharide deacetylase family protein [Parapedobacter soli]|uniref:polysaccharide deacetylase family protein n=1 Tax=Parapedobacter soli TaxID=416955 RepID=UPI0021C96814|nr:polysaccharide deacetylase family protein [Parapedobacter soli]
MESRIKYQPHASDGFDVVFGFDMETDIGSFTPFYEGVQKGTAPLLDILTKHRIPATFYWTGHAAEHNPEIVRNVAARGHETGCHGLLHETLGDPIFPLPNNWPILPAEVEGRLTEATRIVEEVSGERPTSFRCPRLWGSTRVVNVLEDLGYTSDASFPLYFYQSPIGPYHPSAEDWTKPGNMQLVEIPNFCDLTMESNDPYQRDRDQWPLFRTKSAHALMEKAEGFISYIRNQGERPVLCFYFHPWEFYDMPQGAIDFGECSVTPLPFIVENCGEKALKEFDDLCHLLLKGGARFLTAGDLARVYKAQSAVTD